MPLWCAAELPGVRIGGVPMLARRGSASSLGRHFPFGRHLDTPRAATCPMVTKSYVEFHLARWPSRRQPGLMPNARSQRYKHRLLTAVQPTNSTVCCTFRNTTVSETATPHPWAGLFGADTSKARHVLRDRQTVPKNRRAGQFGIGEQASSGLSGDRRVSFAEGLTLKLRHAAKPRCLQRMVRPSVDRASMHL